MLFYLGVDASEYSCAYVSRWADSKGVKAALSNVEKTVRVIIEAAEGGSLRAKGTPECETA